MKVYVYFLTIPEEPYGKYTERKLENFAPVKSHYSNDYYKKKDGAVFELNGAIRFLYAFTTDKNYAKDFEFIHEMNLFTKIERKMDKEEYALFEKEMEHAKLDYYDMDDGSVMLITKSEHHILESSIDDIELHLSNYACLGYEAFKDDYIHALDILLYTLYYQLAGPEAEYYDFNYGFGSTPEGAANDHVVLTTNFKIMYLEVFSLILK